ncbi:hypothetical protein ACO0LO_07535 [Undibacterium sp. TJN25]|uniref:hypothetical protein n=1 Tax=Undibacterium sp. TJN25 TaxID=3413056 RepID=UPI003BF07791
MKTANTFTSGIILASALVTALFASGCAYQATAQQQASTSVQTVTVTAKRMTTDEKIAYDTANTTAQTVVMVAKRLTAEQKLAMAQEDMRLQASAARHAQPAA